jgi:Spy/CpxP family protein refolding chaperone
MVYGLALGLAVAAGVVGVHQAAYADGEAATAQAAADPAGPMGLHGMVAAALDQVTLRPDQRAAVEALKADIKAQSEPLRAAHEALVETVATSVQAGAIDHTTLDPAVSAMQAAAQAHRPVFQDAANRLHALLDAGQRQQLVDALRDKVHAGHGHGMWGKHDHLSKIADELGLSQAQRDAVEAKLQALRDSERAAHEQGRAGMREHFEHMKAVADAFVSDSFDAHALALGEKMPGHDMMAQGVVARLEAALPILTADQRVQLAQLIRTKRLHQLMGR